MLYFQEKHRNTQRETVNKLVGPPKYPKEVMLREYRSHYILYVIRTPTGPQGIKMDACSPPIKKIFRNLLTRAVGAKEGGIVFGEEVTDVLRCLHQISERVFVQNNCARDSSVCKQRERKRCMVKLL